MLSFSFFNIDVQIFVHVALSSLEETNIFVILQEILGKIKKSNGQGVTGMGGKSSEQSKKSHNQFQQQRVFPSTKEKRIIFQIYPRALIKMPCKMSFRFLII